MRDAWWLASKIHGISALACATFLFTNVTPAIADAPPSCSLSNPVFKDDGSNAKFSINLICDDVERGNPRREPAFKALVGLTLYSLDEKPVDENTEEQQKLANAPEGDSEFSVEDRTYTIYQKPRLKTKPARRLLADAGSSPGLDKVPFDIDVKRISIGTKHFEERYDFVVNSQLVRDYNHFLFALWPAGDMADCDRARNYARMGCQLYGYVLGGDDYSEDPWPLDFYPGNAVFDGYYAGEPTRRWIVEKFR